MPSEGERILIASVDDAYTKPARTVVITKLGETIVSIEAGGNDFGLGSATKPEDVSRWINVKNSVTGETPSEGMSRSAGVVLGEDGYEFEL